MRTVIGFPPNIKAIREKLRPPPSAIFCYGDTIYNPGNTLITSSLTAHEAVHSARMGDDPDKWWHAYLNNPLFRLEEEVLAHMAEYTEILNEKPNRHLRRRHLSHISRRLAGPMYGRMITLREAKLAIDHGVMPGSMGREAHA